MSSLVVKSWKSDQNKIWMCFFSSALPCPLLFMCESVVLTGGMGQTGRGQAIAEDGDEWSFHYVGSCYSE